MLRLLEIALFLVPFAAFAGWRLLASTGPSPAVLGIAAVAVVLLAALLLWTGVHGTLGRDNRYVPAQLRDGEIVPGHGAAR